MGHGAPGCSHRGLEMLVLPKATSYNWVASRLPQCAQATSSGMLEGKAGPQQCLALAFRVTAVTKTYPR